MCVSCGGKGSVVSYIYFYISDALETHQGEEEDQGEGEERDVGGK